MYKGSGPDLQKDRGWGTLGSSKPCFQVPGSRSGIHKLKSGASVPYMVNGES